MKFKAKMEMTVEISHIQGTRYRGLFVGGVMIDDVITATDIDFNFLGVHFNDRAFEGDKELIEFVQIRLPFIMHDSFFRTHNSLKDALFEDRYDMENLLGLRFWPKGICFDSFVTDLSESDCDDTGS